MNNIVIGQYIPGNSWIYKIDPRIKISALIILMVATFLLNSFLLMSIMFILMLIMFLTTRVPFIKMIKGLKPLVFLLTFTFFIQILGATPTEGSKLLFESQMYLSLTSIGAIILVIVLYFWLKRYVRLKTIFFLLTAFLVFFVQWLLPYVPFYEYTIRIYDLALLTTGFLILRIIIIIILSSLLTFTTIPTDITNGIESLLKPLKIIRFPVGELAMMLSLTLRFIPTLLDEANKIMKAQASRGVEFSESKFREKIVQIVSLLIPLFVVSFKRAEDLANAMDVRGYIVGGKRTKIDVMKMRISDYIAIGVVTSVLTLAILLRVGVIALAL
ncbi:MAG: energy-coupling factor transporter transmembrane protein EcfT [Acholeplasmataceae bacterium]|jgi:energy-coupling factor transport system permease protein|nr:energy-coupling factor transporter transmembrane protein EcfT [Acholeplasmataceae bacterium]